MRFHIVMERATLRYDLHRKPALLLCPADGEPIEPHCEAGDGYARQIQHFARRIRGETLPPVTTLEDSWNSLRIVLAECESARTGREVALDAPENKEVCHAL